jgi:hypothetical protein
MQRFLKVQLLASLAVLSLVACNNGDIKSASNSQTQSDWETVPAAEPTLPTEPAVSKPKSYVIDWACEPKRYGVASEASIKYQEEYCEWKVVKTTASVKTCRFTTSFDNKRDFYLNSRGKTPVNSISAARYLVDLCNEDALYRLGQGKSVGSLCTGVPSGCVNGRNSDPEICSKVRWATGEKYNGNIDFCVDKLTQRDSIVLPEPLIQFGLLTDLPEGCTYATDDKTEVLCNIPAEDECFSVAGQLRPGMRVQTVATTDTLSELPAARECYRP